MLDEINLNLDLHLNNLSLLLKAFGGRKKAKQHFNSVCSDLSENPLKGSVGDKYMHMLTLANTST